MSAPEPRGAARSAGAPSVARLAPSWLAAQGRLPLAFMGLALIWLGMGCVMLVADPTVLVLPHFAPPVVALVHAWVLGCFVTVAAGAVYQLAPVALGTTLAHERLGWWHLALHAAGVPMMVTAFARGDLALLGSGGSLVAVGIVLFAWNTARTVARSAERGPVAWSLGLAAFWLLLTVVAGVILAVNRALAFIPADPVALLRAHAHAGLIGFFVTLLQGVSFQLVPMFTLGDVPDWRPVRVGLGFSQTGLVALIPALSCRHAALTTAAGMCILAGMTLSAVALRRSLARRKKRGFDPGVMAFLWGCGVLLASAAVGLLLAWPGSRFGSVPGGLGATVYGLIVLAGGLHPAIAGMMCKIVPFLTWMRAYGPKVGRIPTPAAGALTRPRLERGAFALQILAVPLLVVGAWRLESAWLHAGAAVLATGVALFLCDMIGVLRHLWFPITVAPPRRPVP